LSALNFPSSSPKPRPGTRKEQRNGIPPPAARPAASWAKGGRNPAQPALRLGPVFLLAGQLPPYQRVHSGRELGHRISCGFIARCVLCCGYPLSSAEGFGWTIPALIHPHQRLFGFVRPGEGLWGYQERTCTLSRMYNKRTCTPSTTAMSGGTAKGAHAPHCPLGPSCSPAGPAARRHGRLASNPPPPPHGQ
jgi:hypothetical protein